MEFTKDIQCNLIIHTASVATGVVGAGLAQIPTSDTFVITPVQITMITALGKVLGLKITEAGAKSIIASLATAVVGRGAIQLTKGWIPGYGNILNATTAIGLTEAVGWLAVKEFKENKDYYEGMKDGYAQASIEYEEKLKKQAGEFLKEKNKIQQNIQEYEELLNEYKTYIEKLENENCELKHITELKQTYKMLKSLRVC